jgi:hypothetical protein
MVKKNKPYDVRQGEDGNFIAAGEEAIDSPVVGLRMTSQMYAKLEAIAGKKKAQWIREAIAEKLKREQ